MFQKQVPQLENQIYQNVQGSKQHKMLARAKQKRAYDLEPMKIYNPSNYIMESEENGIFCQSQEAPSTYIINLPFKDSLFSKEENEVCEKLFLHFHSSCSNFEYSKKILVVRDPNIKDPENQSSFNKCNSFLKELHKLVYQDVYKRKVNPSYKPTQIRENDFLSSDENDIIYLDLFNLDLMKLTVSLSEAMDRITDDEITNCIVLSSYSFFAPINWFLSPAALGLSYFNYQLSLLTKPHKDDKYYSKTSLPRVTYLSLTGIYSEIDLDVLLAFSENIQIIVLYDESTGPAFTKKGEYEPASSLKEKSVNFQQLSNKLLLIPMKCSKKDDKKAYSPNDFLTVFENLVFPSIEKFKPSHIVLNTSFTFDEINSTPYYIDGPTMGTIISFLKVLCDGRILVFPFKLPNMSDEKVQEIYNQGMNSIPQDHQPKLSSTLRKFGVPFNELYFRDCFCNAFESLADIRELLPPSERVKLRKVFRVNPLTNELCYRISRAYKDHPYYSGLYSKSMGYLATAAQKEARHLIHSKDRLANTIPVYCPDNNAKFIKLHISNGGDTKELVFEKNSQYYMDYEDIEYPTLYAFNARLCEIANDIRTYSPPSHFRIILDYEDMVNNYTVNEEFVQLNPSGECVRLKDSGLCKVDDYIFQVYGTDINTNKDSDAIVCYDFRNEEFFQIKVERTDKPEIMKRQGVTAVAFKLEENYYLYVFGGKVQANTKYKTKDYGVLDIIDIVEVYETNDPRKEWKVQVLPKHTYQNQNQVQYIPYHGSFAYYLPSTNNILIMGGKIFDGSITNWTFPIFEFSVSTKTFTNHWLFLNDLKNKSNRKPILNHAYNRAYIPEAISDYNKNFYFQKKDNSFKFMIQNSEYDIISVYSYSFEKQMSINYPIQVEREGTIIRVVPPNLNKENNSKGFENKYQYYETRSGMSISYAVKSLEEQKVLLSVDNWRLSKKESVIQINVLENYLERMIEANKAFLEEDKNNTQDELALERKQLYSLDNPEKRIVAFENILKLVKAKKLNELLNKDSRLEVMRSYLISNILSSPAFRRSRIKFNNTLKDDHTFPYLPDLLTSGSIQNMFDETPSADFSVFWKAIGEGKDSLLNIINTSKSFLEEWILKNSEIGDDNEEKLQLFNFVPLMENEEKEKALEEHYEGIQATLKTNFFKQVSSSQDTSILNKSTAVSSNTNHSISTTSTKASTFISSGSVLNTADLPQFISEFLNVLQSLFAIYRLQLEYTRRLGAIYARPYEKSLKQVHEILTGLAKSANEETTKFKVFEQSKSSDDIYTKKGIEDPEKTIKIERKQNTENDDKTTVKSPIKKMDNYLDDAKTDKMPIPKFSPSEIEDQKTIKKNIEKNKDAERIEKMPTITKNVPEYKSPKQPEEEVKETFEEMPVDLVSNFKEAIKKPSDYRFIFNKSRSELNVIFEDKDGKFTYKRLRFKVPLRNKRTNKIDFEDISFETSPNAVSLFNSGIICYIEQPLKSRYTDVYNNYKSWILYANLEEAISLLKENHSNFEFLIFRKLFKIAQDEHVFNRTVLLTEESLFLFGGKSVSFKRKYTVRLHNDVSCYIFSKFNNVNQISSEFRDPEVDRFEKLSGEIVSIYCGDKIFIVERMNPQNIEIFKKDGIFEDLVEFEASYDESKQYFVKLNFVNFRGKDEILLILYSQDQNLIFKLFDINTHEFEKGKINIVFQQPEEQQDKLKQIYAGFEEFEITTGSKGNQNLILFSTRGDDPTCSLYKITVGN